MPITPAKGIVNNPFLGGVKHSKSSASSRQLKVFISEKKSVDHYPNGFKAENYFKSRPDAHESGTIITVLS
jgi:hypothetical protein